MNKYLLIAEKASVMKAIKSTNEKHRLEIQQNIGDIDCIALSGHVCRYYSPNEYPQWKDVKWEDVKLPMIPEEFKVTAIANSHEKSILKEIAAKLKNTRYDGIIVATDSDTEGNGIYYLLARYLKLEKYKTLRFFEQSMTDREILHSLLHMTDFYKNERDCLMTNQFLIRSEFDWLIGMNATRAVSIKTGETMHIGRVKANIIKLIYDNSTKIDNFLPHSDYQPQVIFSEGFSGFLQDNQEPVLFDSSDKASAFLDRITTKTAVVTKIERKIVKTAPPQLYKLSTIQKEAGAAYNYNPAKTLAIIQTLYEKQLLSYPRTDGQYVSSEKSREFNKLLQSASFIPSLTEVINGITCDDVERVRSNKKVVNDEEVKKASHDALLPTDRIIDFSKLSEDEQHIYEMICKRFVAQFLPEKEEEKTTLLSDINENIFKSAGTTVISYGWADLYEKKESSEKIPSLIQKGSILHINTLQIHERKSTPPKRLTTSSLIDAMENFSKYLENKNLIDIMKEAHGIGTPATRSSIINEVIKDGYAETKTTSELLYITDKGIRYVTVLKDFSIIEPVQAAKWESMFHNVRDGKISLKDAESSAKEYLYAFVNEIAALNVANNHSMNKQNQMPVSCPYCGKAILKLKWGYACEDSKSGACNFKVSNYDGKLGDKDLSDLITQKKTRIIKSICKSTKNGNTYDARIILNESESQFVTGFEFPKK